MKKLLGLFIFFLLFLILPFVFRSAEATQCTFQSVTDPSSDTISIQPSQTANIRVFAHGDERHWYAKVDPPNPSGDYDLGISQVGHWTNEYSIPGSFFTSPTGSHLLYVYNIDSSNNRENCGTQMYVNVSTAPPPTDDPNCSIDFSTGNPSGSRSINKGESLQISVTGAPTPGDMYLIKSNGNIVKQSSITRDFIINFPDGGTFLLEAWHQYGSGETKKCHGGAISVSVSGTGDCSVVLTHFDSDGNLHFKLNFQTSGEYDVDLYSKIDGSWGIRDKKQFNLGVGVSIAEGSFEKNLFLDGADRYQVRASRTDPNPVDCTATAEFLPTDDQLSGGGGEPGKNPCGAGPNGEIGGSCPTALGNFSSNGVELISKIFDISFGIAGAIALILMVIGAIRVLMSSGDQQKLNGGREQIIAAIAGLLFIVFSILILQFIDAKLINVGFQ